METSDTQLLERFVAEHDEAAFAALIGRYGSMVMNVCRRILNDSHDAEDAFQATFLVLARKASSVLKHPNVAVGGWLYGVAVRTASKLRGRNIVRQTRETEIFETQESDPEAQRKWEEVKSLLDEEISRLPEKCRGPVLLCYLEGKTYAEAARDLNRSTDRVKDMLTKGREILKNRLIRRGMAASVVLLPNLLTQQASAAPSSILVQATAKAAIGFSSKITTQGIISAKVAALTQHVAKALFLEKVKMVALGFSLVATAMILLWSYSRVEREDLKKISSFEHGSAVLSFAFSPDGKTLATAGIDKLIKTWDTSTGRLQHSFHGHQGVVMCVAFSPDGKIIASGAGSENDTVVHLWDSTTGKELNKILWQGGYAVDSLAFSPDGKMLAGAGHGVLGIQLWDVATGKEIAILNEPFDNFLLAYSVAFSPDGKSLASSSFGLGHDIRIWDLDARQAIFKVEKDEVAKSKRLSVAPTRSFFSSDGNWLIYAKDKIIYFYNVSSQEKQFELNCDALIVFIAMSPNGKILAARGVDGKVRLWDVLMKKELAQIYVGKESFFTPRFGSSNSGSGGLTYNSHIAFSPDGLNLVVTAKTRVLVFDISQVIKE
jgi:RNA polymerase sigma factor (sigma-70 family)